MGTPNRDGEDDRESPEHHIVDGPSDTDVLTSAERQVARRLGLPATREAHTEAIAALIALFEVLARLDEKYGGENGEARS